MADNEITFHGVAPVQGDEALPTALTINAELRRDPDGDGDGWAVIDGGVEQCRYPLGSMRTTVSWKADVFADVDEMRRADDHVDDLSLGRVVDMLRADLAAKGVETDPPEDPFHDDAWVSAIATTYRTQPPRI
ncbi:MAG: hypothetical protein JWN62_4447 [Acidimicrobiales bacterium]|nr:hypothetical protein [Acidimicrobiales bacterium]